ncbi:MAG: hypothetical protein ACR2N6_01250 [Miltoncostaeaceae bacterium]
MTDKAERTRVSDEVLERVRGRIAGGDRPTSAIRAVASEMGRSEGSTSSAYYAALRRERKRGDGGSRRQRQGDRHDAASLYREMLPLVEAGASAQQAARRFGGDDVDAAAVATGFERWHKQESATAEPEEIAEATVAISLDLINAEDRLEALEAENRTLRREVVRARQALTRVRAIVDGAIAGDGEEPPPDSST